MKRAHSILRPSQIDLIAHDPRRNVYVLIICQSGPWTGAADELLRLRDKVNAYVAFITSGQMHSQYPDSAGLPVEIQLDYRDEPPGPVRGFLDFVGRRAARLNIGVRLQQLPTGS